MSAVCCLRLSAGPSDLSCSSTSSAPRRSRRRRQRRRRPPAYPAGYRHLSLRRPAGAPRQHRQSATHRARRRELDDGRARHRAQRTDRRCRSRTVKRRTWVSTLGGAAADAGRLRAGLPARKRSGHHRLLGIAARPIGVLLGWKIGSSTSIAVKCRTRVAVSICAPKAPGNVTPTSTGTAGVYHPLWPFRWRGLAPVTRASGVHRTADAHGRDGRQTEGRLDGACREYARAQRPAPYAAGRPLTAAVATTAKVGGSVSSRPCGKGRKRERCDLLLGAGLVGCSGHVDLDRKSARRMVNTIRDGRSVPNSLLSRRRWTPWSRTGSACG